MARDGYMTRRRALGWLAAGYVGGVLTGGTSFPVDATTDLVDEDPDTLELEYVRRFAENRLERELPQGTDLSPIQTQRGGGRDHDWLAISLEDEYVVPESWAGADRVIVNTYIDTQEDALTGIPVHRQKELLERPGAHVVANILPWFDRYTKGVPARKMLRNEVADFPVDEQIVHYNFGFEIPQQAGSDLVYELGWKNVKQLYQDRENRRTLRRMVENDFDTARVLERDEWTDGSAYGWQGLFED